MTPILTGIADDEPLARTRLKRLLQKVGGEHVRVVLECENVDQLVEAATRTPLDLLFLDIDMPGGDGFSALRRWPGHRPHVVFVTAYQEHGVRAFDARALDYVLKPLSAARLAEALERATGAITAERDRLAAKPETARIPLQIGSRSDLVAVDEIDMVMAQRNYLSVYAGQREYLIRRTLRDFHVQLKSMDFVRLHRSIIVRRSAIRKIAAAGSGRYRIELASGRDFHTGRNFREQVQKLLSSPSAG